MELFGNETLTVVNDGIKLIQNPAGLTFGTDALMLAAFVRRAPQSVGAEFGSGSGIISLLLASRGKLKKIYAVENQEYYSLFTNPPYMKVGAGKRNADDGKYAARHEVCGDIYDFCRSAARNLKYGGYFYCVYRPDRAVDLLFAMRESSIEPKRIAFVSQDTLHKPSLMLVEGKRGGNPSCEVMKTLFLTHGGSPTPEAEAIYRTGEWES